ncbi:MAG: hypothetical protein FD165_1919 [Gammaproteobacteria bacterium]|nr:MAG: hypothetical protein FD165_1919 [Gammaproteobacteria bacterium]TND04491.1 MAG: hypothetical protein FD120_1605 [Gammaproteobacteria bacterium]
MATAAGAVAIAREWRACQCSVAATRPGSRRFFLCIDIAAKAVRRVDGQATDGY